MDQSTCKICGSKSLTVFAHTAQCRDCDVLLYYPYPRDDSELVSSGEGGKGWTKEIVRAWYSDSSFYNHTNFTNMLRFAMDESYKSKDVTVLDYGGGGGQFSLIFKSHFPRSRVFITDISDESLLDEWKSYNNQIPFEDFGKDATKFDFIFLNDVFEHVSDPRFVLKQLAGKLKEGGRLFIDTPKQFWIYPASRIFSRSLYSKVLKGTVSTAHLQIWSRKSFRLIIHDAGLAISRYVDERIHDAGGLLHREYGTHESPYQNRGETLL